MKPSNLEFHSVNLLYLVKVIWAYHDIAIADRTKWKNLCEWNTQTF